MDNKLYFKTNIQLKSIIGKDLINDDNIAILELVKNSFDADAKKVSISFLNLKLNDDSENSFSEKTSRIIIEDDGIGMDLNDIKNKWLNIAYSEKKLKTHQHSRMMAGAKGVGRFSCDRLGEYLNLYSRKKNSNKYILLKIDWKEFEIEDNDKEIQNVALDYEELSENDLNVKNITPFKHGVILEIIKLRNNWIYPIKNDKNKIIEWTTNKLIDLKRYLEKLINPNQAFEKNDFGIYLNVPEFIEENKKIGNSQKFIGKIENTIFDKLDFKTTNIESKTIENGEIIQTTLKDKGEIIFWIKEKNDFYPYIKNINLNIFYLNPYSKAFFTKQTGSRSVDYGSIYVFINGFRVPPYGEVENDWLKLDQRKAQGYARYFGTRDLVGTIEILDTHNDFPIVTSREGLVENYNYHLLTDKDGFIFRSLKRLEKYVVDGLDWDSSEYTTNDPQFKEIENKIIKGEIDENDSKISYKEDDFIKKKRIYQSIHSIISAKGNDVKELYINENLILNKIEEEKQQAEKEFQQLLYDFENKKIDSETINRVLQKKSEQNIELEKQLKEFSKYYTNEATSKALLELQAYKKTIEEQTLLIQNLKQQLNKLKLEKDLIEKNSSKYEEKAKKVEEELNIEKEKNLYLLATRRTLSPDADGLIHTIKINNIEIRDGLENIIDDLTESNFSLDNLIRKLGYLKIYAERSLKMAEFATRTDLKENIEKKEIDILIYIKEYVTLYGETFSNTVNFNFISGNISFKKHLSVLNLSIILDNLISNAIKWGAKNILFEFKKESNKQLHLIISDDGNGLSKKFIKNPDKIFELSVRDIPPSGLSGSGIGLFYTKNLLNDMNCDIEFLGNNLYLSGSSFKIIFNTI